MRFKKEQTSTLDYTIIWDNYLNGSTITSPANTVWDIVTDVSEDDDPLVIIDEKFSDTETQVIVSGGEKGKRYTLSNEIVYNKDGNVLSDVRYIEIEIKK